MNSNCNDNLHCQTLNRGYLLLFSLPVTGTDFALLLMAFELGSRLHNKNLPVRYFGCQFIESLLSYCISVVSNHYDFRNIRGPRLTVKLGHQSEHSLNLKDCLKGLRFCPVGNAYTFSTNN